jgi:hypothetical protein
LGLLSCRPVKPIPIEPEPVVPNPYLGRWENIEYRFFNSYSLENGIATNRIDSSIFGKYEYKYNFISNTSLELNYGDTQKVTLPFTIINDKTISIKFISSISKEYNVLKVDGSNLILESQEPSVSLPTTRYTSKKREIWKKLP